MTQPYYYRVIPTQVVPATGLLLDVGYALETGYVTVIESAGVAYTIQFGVSDVGLVGIPLPIPASQPYEVKAPGIRGLRQVEIKGAGATITGVIASYDVPPDAIVVTGPITVTATSPLPTDVGQGTQKAGNTTLESAGTAYDARQIRALTSSDNPDVSVNQSLNFKTDIGVAGTYAKDATLIGGSAIVKTKPLATQVNSGKLAPTALPENTAEAIIAAGAGNVTAGSRLQYRLAVSAVVEVAATTEVIAYVCLKGHTSGNYYALCYAGESVSGEFDFNYVAEAIDIVWRNSSAATGANAFASWNAVSP